MAPRESSDHRKDGKPRRKRGEPSKKKSTATFEDGDEPKRCRAKSKQSGKRCGQPKVPGREVCRFHGGNAGRPPKHGRYSGKLGSYSEMYDDALGDTKSLLDLRDTLALLEVNVQRAASRAADRDTPDFRQRALELFLEARASNDAGVVRTKLGELGQLLERGGDEDTAFEKLTTAAEKMAVRQEKAWGIQLQAAQVINARDLVTILVRFIDIVQQEAPDHVARVAQRVDAEIVGAGQIGPAVDDHGQP